MGKLINIYNSIKGYLSTIDLPLLIFLGMITFSSLIVKALGLILIYIVRRNFNFGLKTGRLPLFYLIIPVAGILQLLTALDTINIDYTIIFCLSIGFWIASFLILHQIKFAIDYSGISKVKKTAEIFFLLNALISISAIVKIMLITHTINPYMYAGMNYHYHVSTGDHIKGIFRDISTTNSCIMLFAFIYFIHHKKYWQTILCLVVVLLTTSNILNILLFIIIIFYIVFTRSKLTRAVAVCTMGIVILFLVKITPNNLRYLSEKIYSTDIFNDLPTENAEVNIQNDEGEEEEFSEPEDLEELRERKIYEEIYTRGNLYQKKKHDRDVLADSAFSKQQKIKNLYNLSFSKRIYGDSITSCTSNPHLKNKPGKVISFAQTYASLTNDPLTFFLGNGPGKFSSKIAFKASGFNIFGNYPTRNQYISEKFKENHLKVLTFYFIQSPDKHSILNTPFSVYNQLPGEYGLLGLLIFAVFYIVFFVKKLSYLSYGKILLPLLLIFLATDYWFEQLSVVIIFELLIFIDLDALQSKVNPELTSNHMLNEQ